MNPLLEQEYLNKIKECKENAKQYYDSGDYEKASAEYLRCSKYCEILVKKTGHERSLVNELLSQMDGLESKGSKKRYLVLAATNMPWDIDTHSD